MGWGLLRDGAGVHTCMDAARGVLRVAYDCVLVTCYSE